MHQYWVVFYQLEGAYFNVPFVGLREIANLHHYLSYLLCFVRMSILKFLFDFLKVKSLSFNTVLR